MVRRVEVRRADGARPTQGVLVTRQLFPATVVDAMTVGASGAITVDGATGAIDGINVTGHLLGTGARVLVDFVAPAGPLITGVLTSVDPDPVFIGKATATTALVTATLTDIAWSDGAGSFVIAPTRNIGGFTASSSNGEVVIPKTGVYEVTLYTRFATNTTGYRQMQMKIGGVAAVRTFVKQDAMSSGLTTLSSSALYNFNDGAGLLIEAWQNSGGNLNLTEAWLQIAWVSLYDP